MGWEITLTDGGSVVLVVMKTNRFNNIEAAFIEDLNQCLDKLETVDALQAKPVVFSSPGEWPSFSAGVGLQYLQNLSHQQLKNFLSTLETCLFRLWTLPRRTVAAIHGHAVGWGYLLALACDVRVAAYGDYKIGLTEMEAGISLPSLPLEIARSKLSPQVMFDLFLSNSSGARLNSPVQAREKGLIDLLVAREELIAAAHSEASVLHACCTDTYAATKRRVLEPCIERWRAKQGQLGDECTKNSFSEGARMRMMALIKNVTNAKL